MQMSPWIPLGFTVGTTILFLSLLFLFLKERKRRMRVERQSIAVADEMEALRQRFSGVFNLDAEILSLRDEISRIETEKVDALTKIKSEIDHQQSQILIIRSQYVEKKAVYDRLKAELAIFDERLAFAEMGVYEPHFDFGDSDKFKNEITKIRDQQKILIDTKKAVYCTQQWSVNGDAKQGKVMTDRNIRLTIRAFNNECEASISNTRWNNVNAMEKRIVKAKEQIEKLNASNLIFISDDYLAKKLQELYLTHEYREQLKNEREERLEAARLQREEQKFLKDKEEAEAEERRYARLLEKARSEALRKVGSELSVYNDQIAVLEEELAEAQSKSARAQALAELTRSGFVYIISNVGSFGEGVVKIGMTRRLDPLDRVKELGSASVPFTFDVHAIIYSEDAPTLEHALHTEFASCRINLQNFRKEFFRTEIPRIAESLKKLAPDAAFITDVEAQEYRETLAKRQALLDAGVQQETDAFPSEI